MFKWYIEILFNSGAKKYGIYECDINNSNDVTVKLFQDKPPNNFIGLSDYDGANLLFRIGDVTAITVSKNRIYNK